MSESVDDFAWGVKYLKKRIVTYEANWIEETQGGPDIRHVSGMVVVSFYDEAELREKLKAYITSQFSTDMQYRAYITGLEYKIIEEI